MKPGEKKFSEQTSFGHEQVRDGISFGKEEERVSIVSYSDVQSLNDLQCFVTLPGSYPVVKLTMKYEAIRVMRATTVIKTITTPAVLWTHAGWGRGRRNWG